MRSVSKHSILILKKLDLHAKQLEPVCRKFSRTHTCFNVLLELFPFLSQICPPDLDSLISPAFRHPRSFPWSPLAPGVPVLLSLLSPYSVYQRTACTVAACHMVYWCNSVTTVPMYQCTGVRCTGVPVYWCTGVLVYQCTFFFLDTENPPSRVPDILAEFWLQLFAAT